ncbi:FecR family protein [Bizionia argentinensis JUB59]|uniref:FecR family protein n=1 Tax=Bizionia argentinensis JUB59 TaxID=1046627 RepID=G2EHM6_9FLAO|nr:FecR family protein [Bizionia argentinensis]EGV42070.1 FecR family protein [Bizionia argentinensis JUB59]
MKTIITSYINDSISEADLQRLKMWLENPKNQETFKSYVKLNNELNALQSDFNSELAFEKVSKQINQKSNNRFGGVTHLLKYAAILVGVSIIGFGVYNNFISTNPMADAPKITLQLEDGTIKTIDEVQNTIITDSIGNTVTEQKNKQLVYKNANSESKTLRFNTLMVPYGKTFAVSLSDGTKVTLNAGSELTYPVEFIENEKNRTVFLNGEAYFEVTPNKEHPFIVSSNDMDIKVLGTKFNVTSYKSDNKTFTVLVEGKVEAYSKLVSENSKILQPNERVFFESDSLVTEMVNVQKYVAWVKGELLFIDDSFKVITNKLERKFNVTIINDYKELDAMMITATFRNETINEVLKTFQTYKTFKYQINNGVVKISKPDTK